MTTILTGDCREVLPTLADASVNCCVTSPPFLWLRDYGIPASDWPEVTFMPMIGLPAVTIPAGRDVLGLEADPLTYIGHLVTVFREVRRALRDDGTLWVEIGDGYANCGGVGRQGKNGVRVQRRHTQVNLQRNRSVHGLKGKDLIGVPWRLALALQADGWYLRTEIVWYKLNPMPESVKDRPTRTHSYIFLLAKAERYWYDEKAISEPCSTDTHARYGRGRSGAHKYADGGPGGHTIARTFDHIPGVNPKAQRRPRGRQEGPGAHDTIPRGSYPRVKQNESFATATLGPVLRRNSRTVWPIAIRGSREAHYATYTAEVPKRCILAGCPQGGTVLDPFGGSGTTGAVAEVLGRNSILIELNPKYVEMAKRRTAQGGLFCRANAPAHLPGGETNHE